MPVLHRADRAVERVVVGARRPAVLAERQAVRSARDRAARQQLDRCDRVAVGVVHRLADDIGYARAQIQRRGRDRDLLSDQVLHRVFDPAQRVVVAARDNAVYADAGNHAAARVVDGLAGQVLIRSRRCMRGWLR